MSNRIGRRVGAGLGIALAGIGSVLGGPLDHWTLCNRPTTQHLWRVTYASNLFVAVGDGGALVTSPNGTSWLSRNSGTSNTLFGVTYGNGMFLAVGYRTVVTSTDGVNWTTRSAPTLGGVFDVAFGQNQFVAVGSGCFTSADGAVWTARYTHSPLTPLFRVTWDGNRFVTVGGFGDFALPAGWLAYSATGDVWSDPRAESPEAFPLCCYLYDVAHGNGRWVVVGESRVVGVCPDELWPWYGWTVSGGDSDQTFTGIAHGAGTFVIVGTRGSIHTTADGLSLTPRPVPTVENLADIAYGDGRFVVVGASGTILRSASVLDAQLAARSRPGPAGFLVQVQGEVGRAYRVEATSDLASPNWSTVAAFTLVQPLTNILDTAASNRPRRFYRLASP